MQRARWIILGALLVAGLVLVLRGRPYRVPEKEPVRPTGSAVAAAPPEPASAEKILETPPPAPAPSDGSPVPPLPKDAPKTVAFGVVVVTFHGAENAPDNARTKSAALAKAKELVTLASSDFAAAVKQGDRGSMEDAGSVPQGVLEPALEYALFTMKKGQVYGEPLESPRGYWVVRRRD